jgi:hypothetical protein
MTVAVQTGYSQYKCHLLPKYKMLDSDYSYKTLADRTKWAKFVRFMRLINSARNEQYESFFDQIIIIYIFHDKTLNMKRTC